jgi:hypothetical protein
MHVSKTIEGPDGQVHFEGELDAEEVDFVLKIGLNFLLQQGALPLITKDTVAPTTRQEQ